MKIGKKGKEWIKARFELIKIYTEKGIIRCENCGSKFLLAFHHRPSRASQEAVHDFKHTRLLCQECHGYFEYKEDEDKRLFAKPRGYKLEFKIDIMAEKKKSKKPNWQIPHKCKHCKRISSMLICPNCGKMTV